MELCRCSFDELIFDEELSRRELVEIWLQLAKGLKEIHDKNYVHRDLKPENILITFNNEVKISDFGISTSLNFDYNEGTSYLAWREPP